MEEKYIEQIQKGNTGEYKSLLLFKGKYNNRILAYYVKFTEDVEEVIKKYTSEQIYQGKNVGVLYEHIYQYDYEYKKVIPFENLYDIEKGMFGYIDLDGNFYPISEVKEHDYSKSRNGLSAGIKARNIVLFSNISEEEKENYRQEKKYDLYEKGFYPFNWSADKILKKNGYCLFFRGIDDEGCYADFSDYDNATEKQLIVMNLLFNLNYMYSTDIENERKALVKTYIKSINDKARK